MDDRTCSRVANTCALVVLQFLAVAAAAQPAAKTSTTKEPEIVLLWPDGAPGSAGRTSAEVVRINEYGEHIVSNVHFPSLTVYRAAPEHSRRTAVVVVPGGGHRELWMDHEGYSVARYLAAQGVSAFVLKYRLARAPASTYTIEGDALADLQRALQLVRSRAADWRIDPERVGVIGFSAGGELALLAATHAPVSQASIASPERLSSRPSFAALMYPAIPSNMQIPADAPPAFLVCGADDQPAISSGLADLYLQWRRAGKPAELHIYAAAGHGFGLRTSNTGEVANWPQVFVQWLDALGFRPQP